jgi:nucleoside-triphosphatase
VIDPVTAPICILSGDENVGKSTLCRRLIEYAKSRNILVSGISSELEIVNFQRKAINSFDIKTGEKVNLAVYTPGWDKEKPERKWKFNRDAINWGNNVLRKSVPTNLLMIDEIGYLELEKGEGWNECFNVLESNQYQLATVVIRPELLGLISQRYKKISVYTLQKHNRKEIEIELMDKLDRLAKS